jgi:hypothetical protein
MTTPFKNNYAFGLQIETVGGHKVIEHGGGIEGFNTELEYYPDDKLTVVVLRNVNAPGPPPTEIANKLAAVARGDAVTLQTERREITLDPKILNRYVGAYQFPSPPVPNPPAGPAMLITLEGDRLVSKLGNQPPVPIFAESETKFFAKVVDSQIEFPRVESDGKASQLILHQGGRDVTAPRLDDTEAKRLADAAAAVAKRFKDQIAAPGSEAALRKLIEDARVGKPDYTTMSAGLAAVTRQQLPQIQSSLTKLGATKSVTFKGVGPAGPDIFEVQFEKGSQEWRIWLGADGKVESANFRSAQ